MVLTPLAAAGDRWMQVFNGKDLPGR